jgi:Arc/MetJ family transcription regulator
VIKRTSLNLDLDLDLVAEAKEVLGTRSATDTVHTALSDAVRRARIERLLRRDFSELTPEKIEELRRPRTETEEWAR